MTRIRRCCRGELMVTGRLFTARRRHSGRTCGFPILPTCATGADIGLCWKHAAGLGGTRTKLVSPRRRSRLPEAGSCSTTECGTRLRAVCIDWGWPCSTLRIRKSACCEGIRGSLGRRRTTNVTATSTTWCSRVGTQVIQMATPSMSTTELLTARLLWLAPACAQCWSGWTPMEVASADERRTYELFVADFSVCLWVSSQANEPRVHDQETNVSGLLQMWPGI